MQATAKTSQIFLGLQVQCTQCHNHPFNEWKQNQFWEMNAFFRQTAARRRNAGRPADRVVRAGQSGFRRRRRQRTPTKAETLLRAAQRHDEGRLSGVRRWHRRSIRSGYVADVDRRAELAQADRGVAEYWPRRS